MTTIGRHEWVSWFIDGKAQHFPVDSKAGRQICEKLGWDIVEGKSSGRRPVTERKLTEHVCPQCGRTFHGRATKQFCTPECKRKARTEREKHRPGSTGDATPAPVDTPAPAQPSTSQNVAGAAQALQTRISDDASETIAEVRAGDRL